MDISRRALISGFTTALMMPVMAMADSDTSSNDAAYVDYDYQDYFDNNTLGSGVCPAADIATAKEIVLGLPHEEPYLIMLHLKCLTVKGESNEPFNSRWKKVANPLIVFMFHVMNYPYRGYPDDEVNWCATALSWCLYWGGYKPTAYPWSSQSFLDDPGFEEIAEKDLKRGDICVFTDTYDSSLGHVGFWSPDQHNVKPGCIRILGANQFNNGQRAVPTRASQVCFEDIPRNETRDPSFKKYLAGFFRPKSTLISPSFSDDVRDFDLPCGWKAK